MQKCQQCDNCNKWYHEGCVNDASFKVETCFCSPKCEMSTLPFGYALYQDLVDCRVFCSTVVYNDEILTGLRNLFSSDVNGTNIPEKFVNIDHFLNLQCSYLDPNLLNNKFLSDSQSDFTIFHQNIRSLGANFHKFDEIFQNCSVLPDIFAFTETKLDEDKSIPEIKGYKFERLRLCNKLWGSRYVYSRTVKLYPKA